MVLLFRLRLSKTSWGWPAVRHSACRIALWHSLSLQHSKSGAAFHQERQLPGFKVMRYQSQCSIFPYFLITGFHCFPNFGTQTRWISSSPVLQRRTYASTVRTCADWNSAANVDLDKLYNYLIGSIWSYGISDVVKRQIFHMLIACSSFAFIW